MPTRAEIQNEVLTRNNFSIRVDHRTLKAQKEEAQRNGDTFLARLFSRVPEKYVGIISCQEDADAILMEPQVVQLVARSTGNNLEMEKDWELMSELDKEELLDKEIVREL